MPCDQVNLIKVISRALVIGSFLFVYIFVLGSTRGKYQVQMMVS